MSKEAVTDISGLRLQAVIMSRKSGIVLQAVQSGTVFFLNEEETADGIYVKSIGRSEVSVEANGKLINFPVSGVKK